MARLVPPVQEQELILHGRAEGFLPDAPRMEKQKAVMVVCSCGGPFRWDDLLRNQAARGRVVCTVTPEGGPLPIAEAFYETDRENRDQCIKYIGKAVQRMDKKRYVLMVAKLYTFSIDEGCEHIVLAGHWPCDFTGRRGLTLPETLQRLARATRYTQAEFARCEVSAEFHMFFTPERMRTYGVEHHHPFFNGKPALRV